MIKATLLVILLVFAIACGEIEQKEEAKLEENNTPIISAEEAKNIRISSWQSCKKMINKSVYLNGTVVLEECGKGGIPSSSGSNPQYCYYGIQLDDGCIVYTLSKINFTGFYHMLPDNWKTIEEVHFKQANYGTKLLADGTVTLNDNPKCAEIETLQDYEKMNEELRCNLYLIAKKSRDSDILWTTVEDCVANNPNTKKIFCYYED